jgi:MFS family permease
MRSDFWKFWTGETISNFGSSITQFALPLLVFKLTGSAVSLGIAFAMFGLPHLFFGLIIGAWADRLDRKRLMIVVDLLSAAVVASVPLASAAGVLSVWWVFAGGFALATLGIFFQAAEFAAIPSLVERDQLVTANGRIQASFSAATILGPLAAGAVLAFVPIESLLYIDALTFVASAVALALIARPFNAPREAARTSIRADVVEGLRYVLRHPVLRNISAMMALINLVSVTVYAQIVLFAKQRFAVSDSELGLLFAADGAGVVVMSLAAGPLRSRYSFGNVALGAPSSYPRCRRVSARSSTSIPAACARRSCRITCSAGSSPSRWCSGFRRVHSARRSAVSSSNAPAMCRPCTRASVRSSSGSRSTSGCSVRSATQSVTSRRRPRPSPVSGPGGPRDADRERRAGRRR